MELAHLGQVVLLHLQNERKRKQQLSNVLLTLDSGKDLDSWTSSQSEAAASLPRLVSIPVRQHEDDEEDEDDEDACFLPTSECPWCVQVSLRLLQACGGGA